MRLLYPLCLVTVLAGCAPLQSMEAPPARPQAKYRVALVEVAIDGTHQSVEIDTAYVGVLGYRYRDSTITVGWKPAETQIGFTLENKGSRSLRVVWDDSAFITQAGSASRVIHEGVLLAERSNSQPPSVVPAGGNIRDIIVPVDNIHYSEYSGWSTSDYIRPSVDAILYDAAAISPVGDRVGILLALDVDGERREYTFTFEVLGITTPSVD